VNSRIVPGLGVLFTSFILLIKELLRQGSAFLIYLWVEDNIKDDLMGIVQ
jgi:hypothetical protein